ncbi:MAG: leucine-rich repeat protein [Candidatus Coproplasma sp.]
MKKKLIISLLATASAITCAFGLTACGEKPHEHKYDSQVVAPTCTEGGYTVHTCACGDSYTDEQTQPTGHAWGKWQTVTEADCTNGGSQKRVCAHDSTHVETKNTDPLGHSFTNYVSDGNATCTEDGTKTAACDREGCNETDTVADVDSKLGHSFTNYVSDGNATCTEDGTKTAICDHEGCNETDTVANENSKLGHDYGEPVWTWDGYESATATFTCANDGTHLETKTATGSYITSVVTTPATCTTDGLKTYTATVTFNGKTYNGTKTETLTKIGHDYGEPVWTWDGYESATATFTCANDSTHVETETATITSEVTTPATCTTDGVKIYTATVTFDGKTYNGTKTEMLTKLGHDYGEPVWTWGGYESATATFTCANDSTHVEHVTATITSVVTTRATCTTDGLKTYTAAVSFIGEYYRNIITEPIAATGHSYSNAWTSDAQYHWHAATCVHSDEIGGKAAHTWDNGYCSVCGKKDPSVPSEGLAYTLSDDETYYSVTGIGTCTDTELVIPSTYNDKPVKSIGKSAFSKCSSLTSVTIPDGVTSIGNYAFYNCSSLTSVTIPDSVTSIGTDAFIVTAYYNDSNNWENGALYIGKHLIKVDTSATGDYIIKDGTLTIACSAFQNCRSLTSIEIPDSVMSIGESAFVSCSNLKKTTIPDSVTSIGAGAFVECSSLVSVTIPDSVTSIGQGMFYDCSGLTSVTIGSGVTSISENAFHFCSSLTSVTIPDSVTSIGKSAFGSCSGLTSVTIGNGVTSIGWYAFQDCYRLIEVKNLSSLTITAGSTDNGCVGFFAKNVYTESVGSSKLSTDENGYIIYDDGTDKILIAYVGTETDLTLPSGITQIYQYAFEECSSLTSITITDGVTSIGSYAFSWCDSLTSITIPDSVTSIGNGVFSGCTALTSVTFENTSGWTVSTSSTATSGESISSTDLANTSTAATYLKSTYRGYYWKRG